jgi:hypothetical protein
MKKIGSFTLIALAIILLVNTASAAAARPETQVYLKSWHDVEMRWNEYCTETNYCGTIIDSHPAKRIITSDYALTYQDGITETQYIHDVMGKVWHSMITDTSSRYTTRSSLNPPAYNVYTVTQVDPVLGTTTTNTGPVTMDLCPADYEFGQLQKTVNYTFYNDIVGRQTSSKAVLHYRDGSPGYAYEYWIFERVTAWYYDQNGVVVNGGYVTGGVKIANLSTVVVAPDDPSHPPGTGWVKRKITLDSGNKEMDVTPSVVGGTLFYSYEILYPMWIRTY